MGKGGQRKIDAPSVQAAPALKVEKGDEWIEELDLNGFAKEIRALGKKYESQQGPDDVAHLNKMVMWSNTCAAVGILSMGFKVNIVTIFALSTWIVTRWTMIAHHTCHGGYDKVHPNKGRWNRFKFGVGSVWRRICDWLDWMMPEAWNVEHNSRHHYNLSELTDPDLVENNLSELRAMKVPLFFKYIYVFGAMCTWKWFYYAPNTYKELKLAKWRKAGKPIPQGVIPEEALTIKSLLTESNPFYSLWEFLGIVLGPYLVIHFFLLPLPLLALGTHFYDQDVGMQWYKTAFINLSLAEVLTNIHGFIIVVTNHAGNDMYRFRNACRPFSGSFYLRQILASSNFDMGDDLTDFMHGWLNYQIEHHMWPNLSMLSYQRAAPEVKQICAKYGVPYVQQNVFLRLKKTIDIMVGTTSMKWFPEGYEALYLKLDQQQESTMSTAEKVSDKEAKAL